LIESLALCWAFLWVLYQGQKIFFATEDTEKHERKIKKQPCKSGGV